MVRVDVRRSMQSAIVASTLFARIAPVALVALLASACSIGWQDQQISTVEVLDDERTLVVGYHCDADASVEAEETADEVRLTFRVSGAYRGDCADAEEVKLDAPLAGRRVIDAPHETEIDPCRATTLPTGQPCS